MGSRPIHTLPGAVIFPDLTRAVTRMARLADGGCIDNAPAEEKTDRSRSRGCTVGPMKRERPTRFERTRFRRDQRERPALGRPCIGRRRCGSRERALGDKADDIPRARWCGGRAAGFTSNRQRFPLRCRPISQPRGRVPFRLRPHSWRFRPPRPGPARPAACRRIQTRLSLPR